VITEPFLDLLLLTEDIFLAFVIRGDLLPGLLPDFIGQSQNLRVEIGFVQVGLV
jgi:hypothetical protein